jgi:hypothetical protein
LADVTIDELSDRHEAPVQQTLHGLARPSVLKRLSIAELERNSGGSWAAHRRRNPNVYFEFIVQQGWAIAPAQTVAPLFDRPASVRQIVRRDRTWRRNGYAPTSRSSRARSPCRRTAYRSNPMSGSPPHRPQARGRRGVTPSKP